MAAKKKRPLRDSYAGVAPSVSRRTALTAAKKQTVRAPSRYIELENELAASRTMLLDLTKQLATRNTELRAEEAEVHFWITEAEHWRNRVVEYERLHAKLPDDARRRMIEFRLNLPEQR